MAKRIVVYTVITGNYDQLCPVSFDSEVVDYLFITDVNFKGETPAGWKKITLPQSELSNKDVNRYFKMFPHELFPQYESSVYVDGNIEILNDLAELVDESLKDAPIALYEHYARSSVYDEAFECVALGLEYAWRVKKQMSLYKRSGFQSEKLFEANVIFRKHNRPDVIKAMRLWWEHYSNYAKRDQLSLTYAAMTSGLSIRSLGKSDTRFNQCHFKLVPHSSNPRGKPITRLRVKLNRAYNLLFSAS